MAGAHHVLIVEDEQHLAEGLRFNLEAEGYAARIVETGELALQALLDPAARYDLVVLDVMLPGIDGFAVVAELRQRQHYVPVLILTARGRPEDVLKGFSAGADDYLPKPTELEILLARVSSLLRRSSWSQAKRHDRYAFSGRTIDFDTLELTVGDRVLKLTLMEANLLKYLIAARGQGGVAQGHARTRVAACARTPTRGPSTTSWYACADTSRRSRRGRSIC